MHHFYVVGMWNFFICIYLLIGNHATFLVWFRILFTQVNYSKSPKKEKEKRSNFPTDHSILILFERFNVQIHPSGIWSYMISYTNCISWCKTVLTIDHRSTLNWKKSTKACCFANFAWTQHLSKNPLVD